MHVRVDLMLKKKMDQLIPTGILKRRVEDAAQVKPYTHTQTFCMVFGIIFVLILIQFFLFNQLIFVYYFIATDTYCVINFDC